MPSHGWQRKKEIDENRMGITGISLGGIIGALAATAEPRLHNVCLILAGGNLEKIILESEETAEIRASWADRQFDYHEVMRRLRDVDPLTYAANLRTRRVLMFNARHDTVIPRECTEALWKAAGEPEIHWWNANHYSAVWYLPAALVQVSSFSRRPGQPRRTQLNRCPKWRPANMVRDGWAGAGAIGDPGAGSDFARLVTFRVGRMSATWR